MSQLEEFASLLSELIKEDWHKIKPPDSKEWEEEFDNYIDDLLNNRAGAVSNNRKKIDKKDPIVTADYTADERLKLYYDIFNMMEGLWLEGRKRIKAIRQCNLSNPVTLDELVNYSLRIRNTTYSPPENMNVTDPTQHYDIFPQYHFLGIPTMDQIHKSRLFSLSKSQERTPPPLISFTLVSEGMNKMVITCPMDDCIIYFQTSRINPNVICPQTGRPMTCTTEPSVYNKERNYNFKVDCIPFTVRAWASSAELKDSNITEITYNPNTEIKRDTKDQFGFMLSR